ncbi:MAG: hypothetical protein ACPGUD_02360 [Parashewanella sp.]
MKKRIAISISLLLCGVQAFAALPTLEQVKKWDAQQQHQKIIAQVDHLSPYKVARYKVQSLLELKEFDSATEFVEQRIAITKTPPQQSLNYNMLGNIKAMQAMDASIFTAASYAGDSLDAYKKAYELNPTTKLSNQSLIGFYVGAPSIVGGDTDKALELALKYEKLDPLEGGLLVFQSYWSQNEANKAKLKFNDLMQQFPNNAAVAFKGSQFYYDQELYSDNHALLKQAIQWPKSTKQDDNTHYHLHYAFAKNAIKVKTELSQALDSIKKLQQAPAEVTQRYKEWLQLREAQILLLMGNKEQAITIAKKARANSDSSKLKKLAKRIIKKGRV